MSEDRIRKLSKDLVEKQIKQAKLKREKTSVAEVVTLEADIVRIKRTIKLGDLQCNGIC